MQINEIFDLLIENLLTKLPILFSSSFIQTHTHIMVHNNFIIMQRS